MGQAIRWWALHSAEHEAMIHATLHLEEGESEQRIHAFTVPAILGRSKLADVTVLHKMISRRHCELTETDDGRLLIKDLDSLNGTFVDATQIRQSILQPGDLITIGPFTFRVDYAPAPAEEAVTETAPLRTERGTQSERLTEDRVDDKTEYSPSKSASPPSKGPLSFSSVDDASLEEDEKTTASGSEIVPELGDKPAESVSEDDAALKKFLKKMP